MTISKEDTMKQPSGSDLLAKLLDLLAEQEGVHIEYERLGNK